MGGSFQLQIQTALLKSGIFFCAGQQQFPDIRAGNQQKGFRCRIADCDNILFYGKSGTAAAVQPARQIILTLHDAPPHAMVACADWEKTFPAGFDVCPYFNGKQQK